MSIVPTTLQLPTTYKRCKNTKGVDPNYYKNNRYAAKGTSILYNKEHRTGPTRTSECCHGTKYLAQTIQCHRDTPPTNNPSL